MTVYAENIEVKVWGSNKSTFTSVIDKVGPFEQTLKSSGDREWGQRVFCGFMQITFAWLILPDIL